MEIVCILFGIVSFILLVTVCLYRRQVVELSRQVAFLKNNETSMMLTTDCKSKEIVQLVEETNELLQMYRESKIFYERQNRQLKNTITGLSHDIRTPLTSLDGYFQLLQETQDEAEKEKYMAIIRKRIDSLRSILEELFTYARLQDNDTVIEIEKVCFSEVVQSCLFSYYDDFNSAGIEPKLDLPETSLYINANTAGLKRVLENIIKNALLHGSKYVAFSFKEKNGELIFSAENDVKNPDEIDMSLIFERFYKADEARQHVSTGLGLSIAKALTEKMNGTITAELDGNHFSIEVGFMEV